MNSIFAVIAITLVVSVVALAGYAIFQITPLAHHTDRYRDPLTGRRRWESPHLDD